MTKRGEEILTSMLERQQGGGGECFLCICTLRDYIFVMLIMDHHKNNDDDTLC